MKYLILFEDTYGIADIFCKFKNIPFVKAEHSKELIKVNSDIGIITGLSGKDCIRIKDREAKLIHKYKPEYLIIVLDMDKGQNDGSNIIDYESAKQNINKSLQRINFESSDTIVRYVPTVYAAETIMLYQYIVRNDKNFCIEHMVHVNNTWKFHLFLLAILNEFQYAEEAKKVRNYIRKDILEKSLNDTLNKYVTENKEVINFILNDNYFGLDSKGMLDKIKHIGDVFMNYKDKAINFKLCGVELNTNDILYSKKKLFDKFPIR